MLIFQPERDDDIYYDASIIWTTKEGYIDKKTPLRNNIKYKVYSYSNQINNKKQ